MITIKINRNKNLRFLVCSPDMSANINFRAVDTHAQCQIVDSLPKRGALLFLVTLRTND